MSLKQLKTACEACFVCEDSNNKDSNLFEFESEVRRFLFILDSDEVKYIPTVSTKLSSLFDNYSITLARRCKGLESEISLNTCGVFTKLLLRYFPVVWMGVEGAKQLNLNHEPGKTLRIEGCIIYFGLNCIDDDEIKQLKSIDADYTNLKNLIGG